MSTTGSPSGKADLPELIRSRALVPEDLRRNGDAAMRSLVRACIVAARAVTDRSAHRSGWPDDRNVEMILRAPVAPTTTSDASAFANIVLALVASLVPVSAAAAVIARSLKLDFGHAAQITVPSLSLPNAAWIGEGAPIPVVEGTVEAATVIVPFKLATMVSLTNEMVNGSNAEALVRAVLIENVGATLDAALFSAAAEVPGLSPAGILNGIATLTPTAGGGADAMVGDVAQIAEALAPVSGGGEPVLVCAPAQAVALRLRTARDFWPVFASAALPRGTLIGVVPSGLATVVEPPRIEASGDAVIHRADPAAEAVDIGGILATPLISSWQTDSVAMKIVLSASWARRSANAVVLVEGAAW